MTEFEIYSPHFYETLDKRIEEVEEENEDVPFLPLDEYMKQQDIVENFLRKNHLKIDLYIPYNIYSYLTI